MVELLSPAGDLERLKIALLYGADAVYIGGAAFGLRANAINFTLDEIREGVSFAHNLNKKVYVTVNIALHNKEVKDLLKYLQDLEEAHVDAIIASDPAIIKMALDKTNLEVHLSTQASTLNKEACAFFKDLGVKRIVLAREASKEDIKEIIDSTDIEIEVFIHGAMCSSYSGRCVLSNFFTGRDANRGGCAQICRWDFDLIRDDKIIDNQIKFTMCSKDLCMLENIPSMIDIGVSSLKIEGRMRSIYYIAMVINNYRRVIDEYYNGTLTPDKLKHYRHELNKVAARDNTEQFYNSFPSVNEQYFLGRNEVSKQDYLALVDSYDGQYVTAISKNYFKTGDKVDIISPTRETITFIMPEIYDMDGNIINLSNHPEEKIKFKFDKNIEKFDMIRLNHD